MNPRHAAALALVGWYLVRRRRTEMDRNEIVRELQTEVDHIDNALAALSSKPARRSRRSVYESHRTPEYRAAQALRMKAIWAKRRKTSAAAGRTR
jgi:hypothetical protein